MKKKATTILVAIMTLLCVQTVSAADAFQGWDDETKDDAWTVYSSTDWRPFKKELMFNKARLNVRAEGISKKVSNIRDQVKEIISKESESYGMYDNKEYTEMMLCLIQVLSNGNPDSIDPANAVKYFGLKSSEVNFTKSIQALFRRYCVCESVYLGNADLFTNDDGLKRVIQGVVFTSKYCRSSNGYTEEGAKNYKAKNKVPEDADPAFARKVSGYYKCINVSSNLPDIARAEIGRNAGGEKFWRYMGFSSRVEWCACFVSWCANQGGYIASGAIPKYSLCSVGSNWFKSKGLWQTRMYEPNPGDIAFFDWDGDGVPDHTAIVDRCENGIVYTIDGNWSDNVAMGTTSLGSTDIYGYGTPIY